MELKGNCKIACGSRRPKQCIDKMKQMSKKRPTTWAEIERTCPKLNKGK